MKVAILLCVVAAGWAAPQGGYDYQGPIPVQREPVYPPAQYTFQWDVNDQYSGNYYGHQEQRDGDNTQGTYYVQLPDSRLMRVDYYADASGFHPTVTFEGEAQYPAPAAATPRQTYQQPAPAPAAPRQVYTQPAPAPAPPAQVYTQPAPAPQPPRNVYSTPGGK